MRNINSEVIIILCSYLCVGEDTKPFETVEWSKIAEILMENSLTPKDLIDMKREDLEKYFSSEVAQRILTLFKRSGSITFEIQKLKENGIEIVTRADENYPRILKRKLKKNCPPLFYYVGDISLCNKKSIGIVGSRNCDKDDEEFTKNLVKKIIDNNYAIVSGGARGIDSIASETALENNGIIIEYLSDSLLKKIKKRNIINAIRNKQLLLLSSSKPDAGFNVGMAMARNKYIYSQSEATIVIKSDYKKGGSWNGAVEAMKKGYCKVVCRENENSKGNIELINNGAMGVSSDWNLEFEKATLKEEKIEKKVDTSKQLDLFS